MPVLSCTLYNDNPVLDSYVLGDVVLFQRDVS